MVVREKVKNLSGMGGRAFALLLFFGVSLALLPAPALASAPEPIKEVDKLSEALGEGNAEVVNENVVKLVKDTTVNKDILWGGSDVTLDVGDYTLTFGGSTTNNNELVLYGNGASLTVTGTSKGKITTNGKYPTISMHGNCSLVVDGALTIENQSTDPGTEKELYGVAISAARDEVTEEEAKERGNGAKAQAPIPKTIDITGATVTGVCAVKVDDGSTLTIHSGTFTGNGISGNKKCWAVGLDHESTAYVKGGTLTGGVSGVDVESGSTLDVTGGTIEGKTFAEGGETKGGVGIKAAPPSEDYKGGKDVTVSVRGGSVEGVQSGIQAYEDSVVTVDGGSVKGVESGIEAYKGSVVTVGGNASVSGRYGAVPCGGTLNVEGDSYTGATVAGTAAGIGTTGDAPEASTINVSGGIIKGGTAGMYLPSKENAINNVTITDGIIYGEAGIVDIGSSLKIEGGAVTANGESNVDIGDANPATRNYKPAAVVIAYQGLGSYNEKYGDGGAKVEITNGTFVNKQQGKNIAPSPIMSGNFNSENGLPVSNTTVSNGVTVSGGLFSPIPTADYCDMQDLQFDWTITSDSEEINKKVSVAGTNVDFTLEGEGTPNLAGIQEALNLLEDQDIEVKKAPDGKAEMIVPGGWTVENNSQSNVTVHNRTGSTGPGLDIKPGETVDVPKENTVIAIQTEHGTISVSDEYAQTNAKVTITTKPDEGYLVDSVAVTGKDGKAIEAKDGADGTYTFTMPASSVHPVTVKAFFAAEPEPATATVYRLYNKVTGEHLLTTDENEYETLPKGKDKTPAGVWVQEGARFETPKEGIPVYRLYNRYTDEHLYSTDANEIAVNKALGWVSDNEGEPVFYSADKDGVPIYRLWTGYEGPDSHHLTEDTNEYKVLHTRDGWKQEGVKFYATSVVS